MKKIALLTLLLALATTCFWYFSSLENGDVEIAEAAKTEVESPSDTNSSVASIVSSEELILSLTPKLKLLNKSLANLSLPDDNALELFSANIHVATRVAKASEEKMALVNGVQKCSWSTPREARVIDRNDLELWTEFLSGLKYLNHGKIYLVRGEFTDANRDEYLSKMGSSGSAVDAEGKTIGWSAKIEAMWSKDPETESWTISKWKTKSFETTIASRPIFADVLADTIEDKFAFSLATNAQHDNKTANLYNGQQPNRLEGDSYPFFFSEVTLEHPSVAVVDIDSDGFDDFFVAMHHTRNLLFRNNQNGGFVECAADYGLDKTANCSAAIFADVDNDGDPDLFLGRPRHRGKYLVNNNGTFEDRTEDLIGTEMPYMVSSITTADYNRDGLLDVHISTYGPLENFHQFSSSQLPVWCKHYLNDEELGLFKEQLADTHVYLCRPGPPNLLLVNVGNGAFEKAPENADIQLWRQSFQGSWNDFDSDGDPDLYVANDFGPDNFLRNDYPNGFTDVTEEIGIAIGFGMGVSWNDYDNDGLTDLYVTNMFSKAGTRITADVANIDPRFKKLATGNYLYRGNGERFQLISGDSEGEMKVAKAGWAWGSQFIDFNNDGFKDIYSPNGYYTAPDDIAVDIDL